MRKSAYIKKQKNHAKRLDVGRASSADETDDEWSLGIARARAYLETNREQILHRLALAKTTKTLPQAGALAGPIAKGR